MNRALLMVASLAALIAHESLQAASIFRCVDERGRVTFTLQGCPAYQSASIQQAFNPTPGSGTAVPLANTGGPHHRPASRFEPELTVVGERDDGCGNRLTGRERRTAIVRGEVRQGMSLADVESALGTPDSVSSRNGQTRYAYKDRQGGSRTVSFDAQGCVSGRR